jgi:NAD(P)-dependent dehydrogenase (short-subunit alcohol dehydrogenase family)
MRRFEGKTGVLTGGAKGIGRATTLRFLAEGGRIAVLDKEPEGSDWATALRRDAGDAGNRLAYFSAELTDEGSVAAAMAKATDALGGTVDVLVNNCGLGANPKPLETMERAEWDLYFAINITSAFLVTKQVLAGMRQRRYGRIVNLSSITGRSFAELSNIHYSSTKAALMGFTRKLAYEEGPNNIAVNAVAPGITFTDRVRLRHEASPVEMQQARDAGIPLRRPGKPEEIASAILFLASDDASYITGVVLDVNGGKLMA